MKVKKGLIKGAAADATPGEVVAEAPEPEEGEGAAAQTDAEAAVPGEGADAEAAAAAVPAAVPGEGEGAADAAAAAAAAAAKLKAEGEGAEAEEAKAEAEKAKAEEEVTQKLIDVNEFMRGFFNSFDENNDVVNDTDFPDFNNIGKLSVKIIDKSRQEEIKGIYGKVLDNYKKFLTQILS